MTDSFEIHHHLQSYFMMCQGDYQKSGRFVSKILEYSFPESKSDVILEGEIEISKFAENDGVSKSAIYPYECLLDEWRKSLKQKLLDSARYIREYGFSNNILNEEERKYFNILNKIEGGCPFNPSHLFWEEIISNGGQFVKKELVLKNPSGVPGTGLRMNKLLDTNIISHDCIKGYIAGEKLPNVFGSRWSTGPTKNPQQIRTEQK